jgi:hypothetical protein
MVEHVGRVGGEGQVVPARSGLVQASRSATASAQATGADSATTAAATTPSAAATSTTAAPCSTAAFHLGTNPNHFAHAHVQADIRRTGANAKGNDLFVGAEGVGVEAAKLGIHTFASLQLAAKVGRALNWLFLVRSLPTVTLYGVPEL